VGEDGVVVVAFLGALVVGVMIADVGFEGVAAAEFETRVVGALLGFLVHQPGAPLVEEQGPGEPGFHAFPRKFAFAEVGLDFLGVAAGAVMQRTAGCLFQAQGLLRCEFVVFEFERFPLGVGDLRSAGPGRFALRRFAAGCGGCSSLGRRLSDRVA